MLEALLGSINELIESAPPNLFDSKRSSSEPPLNHAMRRQAGSYMRSTSESIQLPRRIQ